MHASNIIASEKLFEFGNILLGGFVTLGNSAPFIKKISRIKWWHVITHEFVLYIFPSLNWYLKSGFSVSSYICPVLARLSIQFHDSESDFLYFIVRVPSDVLVHAV